MGYWVTLPIAVAAAFHHSLHSVYISLTHPLPLSASFSRLNSACAACVLWVELDGHVRPLMSNWISPGISRFCLLACAVFIIFTRRGNKTKWTVWCACRRISWESLLIIITFLEVSLHLSGGMAVNPSSGKKLILLKRVMAPRRCFR